MNTILILFCTSVITLPLYAQLDSIGLGNDSILNSHEIQFLDSIFRHTHFDTTFDFRDMKIVYVGSDKRNPIISKKEFFKTYIAPYTSKGEIPHFTWKGLTKEEKIKADGTDILVCSYAQVSNEKIYKLIRKSKKN